MRETQLIMGMPITIELIGSGEASAMAAAFDYFRAVDAQFSPYKADSEVSAINRGEIAVDGISPAMAEVLSLSLLTRHETQGAFDVRRPDGHLDPSGLVKGWSIRNAARMVEAAGIENYCIEAGGDIQCHGRNAAGEPWRVGVRHPFDGGQIVKVLAPGNRGVATSGNYVRGAHIYDPHTGAPASDEIVSLTVIGSDVYEADRFATAAYAMGREGIAFIEAAHDLEGFAIDAHGTAVMTSGFRSYVVQ